MAVSNGKQTNRKLITLGVVAGVGILGFWVLWHLSIFGQAPDSLSHELAAAKADGLPSDYSAIRFETSAPDSENAAPILKVAMARIKEFDKTPAGKAVSKITGKSNGPSSVSPADLDLIAPSIAQLQDVFDLLSEAVKKPRLDFHRAWDTGPGLMFPEFADEKSCTTRLILKSKIDLKSGNAQGALSDLDVAAKLSALVGQEPVIIAMLVQSAMRASVCSAVADVIRAKSEDDAVLTRAKTVLDDLGPLPDVLPAIRSEFLFGRSAFKVLASSNAADMFGSDNSNAAIKLARFGPIRTVYDLRYTQFYHTMYRRLAENPKSIVAIDKVLKEASLEMDQKSRGDWTYGIAEILAPVFSGLGGAIGESEARKSVTLCAIDLLKARRVNGHFPPKIPGEKGEWEDPFTERPLIYRPTNTGFVIYSVGRDLKDDGGKPRPKNSSGFGENYDIPFAFP